MIKKWLRNTLFPTEGKTLEEIWRVMPTKDMFHPVLRDSLDDDLNIINQSEFILHITEPVAGCFMFPLFSKRYCRFLIAEGNRKGTWGINKRDHYSAYEINLIKVNPFTSKYHRDLICLKVINKVLAGLFDGYMADEVQAMFLIRYTLDTIAKMDSHYDEKSLVSVSINLNDEFEGGGLSFVRDPDNVVVAPQGYAAMFAGNPFAKHRALPITEGERYVCVYWLN